MFKKKHFLELIQDVKLEKFSKFFNFYRWININETENIEDSTNKELNIKFSKSNICH